MDTTLLPPLFAGPPRVEGHAACNGCGLCQLVCPVWRDTRDVTMTPHGRSKLLQHGASVADLADSINRCSLCGACEPVCPERLPVVDLTLDLRRQLRGAPASHRSPPRLTGAVPPAPTFTLLADAALRAAPGLLEKTLAALSADYRAALADDDGADIAAALRAGEEPDVERIEAFLRPLRRADVLVVADALLLRQLPRWIPGQAMLGLGEAVGRQPALRQALGADDLYVIDAAAFHLDYERRVRDYDALRVAAGCQTNLDLQRIAIPADDAGQARWILAGKQPRRIVIEREQDRAAFAALGDWPIKHVAELTAAGGSSDA